MKKYYIIDRIEQDIAVCEGPDGQMVPVPLAEFFGPVQEGDLVYIDECGLWRTDEEATNTRRKEAAGRYRALFKKKKEE